MITLLHSYAGEVGIDQRNVWANEFDLHHPVLSDEELVVSDPLWPGDPGRPKSVLIGPGATLVQFSPSVAEVEAALDP